MGWGEVLVGVAKDIYDKNWQDSQARKDRAWQKGMSDTSHKREVADLRAAGLNPILSANKGAPMGGGAQASHSGDTGSDMIQSALEAKRLAKDLEAKDAEIALSKAVQRREHATAKNLNDSNAGIKAESDTKNLLLRKVQEGMSVINNAQKNFKPYSTPLKTKP